MSHRRSSFHIPNIDAVSPELKTMAGQAAGKDGASHLTKCKGDSDFLPAWP